MNNYVETAGGSKAPLGGLEKYGILLMGIFLIILSGGRFVTPTAAFLAPIFLLRFTRNTSVKLGVSILYYLLFISLLVRLHDYISVPRPQHLLLIAGLALLEVLPFLLDRLLFKKLPSALAAFVLPCAFVALGFIGSQVFPFGAMGERAYSQVGNIELMQLLGVTGIHGITFIIFWFAAAIATFWDSGFSWRRCRSQVMPMLLVVMIVFVSGGFSTIFNENESETVRVAGVIGHNQQELIQSLENSLDNTVTNNEDQSKEDAKQKLAAHHDSLFERTKNEAIAGASIVSWSEMDGVVLKSQEAQFVERAAQAAVESSIYLVATMAVVDDTQSTTTSPIDNKLIVFNPQGDNIGQYTKSKALWNEHYATSDNEPLLLDTEFGTLGFAIGFDMDFPAAIRTAALADIIIAPSSDWKTLSPHHSLMATFRGVENGASVFRPTNNGLSIASDPQGRILSQTDHFRTTPHSIVADIPIKGETTFYSGAGDWFAWGNFGLLVLLLLAALINNRRSDKSLDQSIRNADPMESAEARDRSRVTAIQWREAHRDNNLDRDDR